MSIVWRETASGPIKFYSHLNLILFMKIDFLGFNHICQAGNLGVLQGAQRFDHTRGYKFSTYVQYWIRKSISMVVAQHARGIRIPVCDFNFREIVSFFKSPYKEKET